jgi:hypothetical protein
MMYAFARDGGLPSKIFGVVDSRFDCPINTGPSSPLYFQMKTNTKKLSYRSIEFSPLSLALSRLGLPTSLTKPWLLGCFHRGYELVPIQKNQDHSSLFGMTNNNLILGVILTPVHVAR